jgi:hypothetical protein
VLTLMVVGLWWLGCGDGDAGSSSSASGGGGPGGGSAAAGGGGAEGDCVDVSGSGQSDLLVSGSGFDTYGGERVHVAVVALDGVGIGKATITAGVFELSFSALLSDYTSISIYIDTSRDDVCDLDEPFWEYTTGILPGDVTFSVTPEERCENMLCGGWNDVIQAPCSVNGLLDLTEPQPCSSN